MDIEMLEDKAFSLRKQIMEVGYKTQSGHLSSALSVVEIMTVLYYAGFLGIDKSNHQNIYRNRFVLSKGHACIIQYLILADLGIIEKKHLWNFCKPTGILGAHPDCLKIAGIDATTGSLGHGLSFAIGTALAAKKMGTEFMTYVVLGDGECQEGSIWEAALCAGNKAGITRCKIIDSFCLHRFSRRNNNHITYTLLAQILDECRHEIGFSHASRKVKHLHNRRVIIAIKRIDQLSKRLFIWGAKIKIGTYRFN